MNSMNMAGLRTFLTAVELKSTARAAKELGIPQDRVRYRIALVEKALGVQLLEQGSASETGERGRTKLTEAGREFLPIAIDAMSAHDRMFGRPALQMDDREVINRVVATELIDMAAAALKHDMSEELRDYIYKALLTDRP